MFGAWRLGAREPTLAGIAALLAVVPALAAWREWNRATDDRVLAIALASSALTAFAALAMLTGETLHPVSAAAVAGVLVAPAWNRGGRPLRELA